MSLKNVILGIAIVILTIAAVSYGINVIYERPNRQDYCPEVYQITTSEACVEAGGVWYGGEDSSELKTIGRCDNKISCYKEYDDAREKYSKNLFLITLPLGILLIVGGVLIFGLEVVGGGLAGGGVGVILYGVMNYWQYSANLLKFMLSLIGLIIVIGLAYWFNKKK